MDDTAHTAGLKKEFWDSELETKNEPTVHTSQREEKESVIKAGQDCTGTELIRYTMTTFLLTIDVSINGKRVSLTKDCSQLMLCCKSLKLSENFKTILPAIEGILQKNGVLQIGKCHGLPFLGIEIEFGTCEDMTSFLSCLKQMKACLLPPFRKHLVDRHEQAGRSVEMHLDLSILLLFQSKDGPRFATVNLSNCSQCFKILCAGELQYRSSTLTSETCSHPKSDVEFDPLTSKMIFNELREVGGEDWFMLGVQLGVPTAKLNTIKATHTRDLDRCKFEMIEAWIKVQDIASWSDILSALLACAYDGIAIRIAKKHDTPLPREKNEGILSERALTERPEVVTLRQQLHESQKYLKEVTQKHKEYLSREVELNKEKSKLIETVNIQAKLMSKLDEEKRKLSETLFHSKVGLEAWKFAQEGYEKDFKKKMLQASTASSKKFKQELQTKEERIESLKQSIKTNEQKIEELHAELKEKDKKIQTEASNTRKLKEHLKQKEEELSDAQQKIHQLEIEQEKLLSTIKMKQEQLDRIRQLLPTSDSEDKNDVPPPEYEQCQLSLPNFKWFKEKNQPWYSPPFHSHQKGYKFCLVVFPNGSQRGQEIHLSLCVTMMRGEHDDNVPWPFRGHVTVMMLNQKENCNHIIKEQAITQELADKNEYDYGGRLECKELSDRGVGFPCFVAQDQLETCGYLLKDSLEFQISVVCTCSS